MKRKYLALQNSVALDVDSGMMYWIENPDLPTKPRSGIIFRSNFDLGNKKLLTENLDSPESIALDLTNRMMYWTEFTQILRADLDGWGGEIVQSKHNKKPGSCCFPRSIALDVPGGMMYWTDDADGNIRRADLDGCNVEILRNDPQKRPYKKSHEARNLALDLTNRKVYWTTLDSIFRADLDGGNLEFLQHLLFPAKSIKLDVDAGMMYWAERAISGKICCSEMIAEADVEVKFFLGRG